MKGFSDSKDEIKEKLTESENLMEEFTMSWEEKEKNTEIIKQVGVSVRPLIWSFVRFLRYFYCYYVLILVNSSVLVPGTP